MDASTRPNTYTADDIIRTRPRSLGAQRAAGC